MLIDHLVYAAPDLRAAVADVDPDPPSVAPLLAALGADIEIRPAPMAALVARLRGPDGRVVLR